MDSFCPVEIEAFKDLVAGELVLLTIKERSHLAICVRPDRFEAAFIVFDHDGHALADVRLDQMIEALSYGSDWQLELLPLASVTMMRNGSSLPPVGTAVLTTSGPALAVMGQKAPFLVGVEALQADTARYGYAGPFGWRIWASQAERDRLGAEPIFEWEHPIDPQVMVF